MAGCGVRDDTYQSALHSPPRQLCPQVSKPRGVNPHLQPAGKAPSTSGVLCLLIAAVESCQGCAGFLLHEPCGNVIEALAGMQSL